MVRLYLFGAPRLERDGLALPMRRSKSLALLAYLAVTGRPHGREGLLALLWSEFADADARNNLRRELSQLRATLGEQVLVTDRRQVEWSQHPDHWVDVAAFGAHIAAARAHDHPAGLCEACADALAEAAQLAGAELLDGYHLADSPAFEEWLFFQREELRQQLGWTLEALVDWHMGRSELQPALTLARRWVSLDPLHEPPRRALMRLLAQAGQHAAALRSYEEGARLLASELGATPEAATIALYEAIKSRELVPVARVALAPPQVAPPATGGLGARGAEEAWPPLTSFIGRRREIDDLAGRLADPTCRMLSLVGPGGIGKTRLAGEVAARCRDTFADGVAVVPLSGATLPTHIAGTVASALGLPLVGASDGWPELATALRDRELLLVLDNLEQLVGAASPLAGLLHAAPRVKLLVTSREAVGLQEEWLWSVTGLEVPADGDEVSTEQTDAVQLFIARARQRGAGVAGADLGIVARICRLVGGMPLAIELAAAWTSTLSCAEIASELAGGLELLATELHNVPERHRSVRAVFDQTWDRLAPALQLALARLSVFPTGCTREAAAAVAEAPAPVLTQLVERALLQRTVEGRYQLHPLVRQYAGQQLRRSSAEARAAEAACGRYYAQFLCAQFARSKREGSVETTRAVRAERENIRVALPAILEQTSGESLRRVLQMVQDVYFTCGPYQEGVELLEVAEAHLRCRGEGPEAGVVRAHVLTSLGLFAVRQGNIDAAREYFTASSALFAQLGAVPLEGDATDPEIGLGLLALIAGDYRAASRYAERVRARSEATGQKRNLAYSWYLRAEAAQAQGLFPAAHTAARQALALIHATGAVWFGAYVRNQIGQIAAALGRYDEADGHFQASYASREAFGDREGMAVALLGLGDNAARRGDHERAAERYTESLALYEQTGDRGGTARALLGLGAAQAALGDYPCAWTQIQAALRQARALDYQHVVLDGIVHAAAQFVAAGSPEQAPALLALALVHPASRNDTTTRAQQLLARCEQLLQPASFAEAVARGRDASLEALVDKLLAATAPVTGGAPTHRPASTHRP